MPVYSLNAILQMAATSSLLLIMAFAVQRSVSQSPISKPVIRLDQRTGVYVVGETVIITCSVSGDDRNKTFHFYRGHRLFSSPVLTTNNIEAVHVIAGINAGLYSCSYRVFVNGRSIESPMSQHLMMIITDPPSTPVISLDQPTGVYVVGETVTITCTVTGDYWDKIFHFYRGDQILSPSQLITKNNIGTVYVTAGTNGEQYSCAYNVSVNGRRIDSPLSEPVIVTVTDDALPCSRKTGTNDNIGTFPFNGRFSIGGRHLTSRKMWSWLPKEYDREQDC
ncbi:Fc receptor-like protein 2 [Cetorhinus maximus]